jgi:hypothetical protein
MGETFGSQAQQRWQIIFAFAIRRSRDVGAGIASKADFSHARNNPGCPAGNA